MAKTTVEQGIIDALEAVAPAHDIDIVDVEVTGSSRAPIVCVRIDHADEDAPTITLDEVTVEGDWIGAVIDELDPFPGSFTLEVSSPGIYRPLRRPHDFERFAGTNVALVTSATEGRRRWSGRLEGLRDGKVLLACDEGPQEFPLDQIKECTLRPTIDFSGKGKDKGKPAGRAENR